ncbi:MAG: LysR substrate-binding domain-containing protein [Azospirillaceae bacterium]|nr:LysR substrate-binding domain-containing protein [Azospirillaceae bacterium]
MDNLLTTVSLRRLQVFLAVCETLHMARAAERLGVAQPALSQQIAALEAALGVRLFNRRKRGIDLTAAGAACRAEAERLLAAHAGAIDTVRRTARGEAGRLSLGYVASSLMERDFPAQLKVMRDRYPDVELALREGGVAALLDALERGELDAALVRAPVTVNRPLVHQVHSSQDLVAILPKGHPLAELEAVPITRLAGEALVGFDDPEDVGIMRVVSDLAATAGTSLQMKWRVSAIGSVLGLVAAGMGYGIVPRNIALLAGAEIVVRPLADTHARAELWLLWHEQRRSPTLARFLAVTGESTRQES